ncbi:hypothetical protein [Nesterenkonia muleiensis]|uniref:hypothetical protein n=1 Tax=Nesterenkonia muleiensis TaxID=2282648 RepID=UPI001EE443F9|nr:hypothetical protein [Nesterenkonia muleiensis]
MSSITAAAHAVNAAENAVRLIEAEGESWADALANGGSGGNGTLEITTPVVNAMVHRASQIEAKKQSYKQMGISLAKAVWPAAAQSGVFSTAAGQLVSMAAPGDPHLLSEVTSETVQALIELQHSGAAGASVASFFRKR